MQEVKEYIFPSYPTQTLTPPALLTLWHPSSSFGTSLICHSQRIIALVKEYRDRRKEKEKEEDVMRIFAHANQQSILTIIDTLPTFWPLLLSAPTPIFSSQYTNDDESDEDDEIWSAVMSLQRLLNMCRNLCYLSPSFQLSLSSHISSLATLATHISQCIQQQGEEKVGNVWEMFKSVLQCMFNTLPAPSSSSPSFWQWSDPVYSSLWTIMKSDYKELIGERRWVHELLAGILYKSTPSVPSTPLPILSPFPLPILLCYPWLLESLLLYIEEEIEMKIERQQGFENESVAATLLYNPLPLSCQYLSHLLPPLFYSPDPSTPLLNILDNMEHRARDMGRVLCVRGIQPDVVYDVSLAPSSPSSSSLSPLPSPYPVLFLYLIQQIEQEYNTYREQIGDGEIDVDKSALFLYHSHPLLLLFTSLLQRCLSAGYQLKEIGIVEDIIKYEIGSIGMKMIELADKVDGGISFSPLNSSSSHPSGWTRHTQSSINNTKDKQHYAKQFGEGDGEGKKEKEEQRRLAKTPYCYKSDVLHLLSLLLLLGPPIQDLLGSNGLYLFMNHSLIDENNPLLRERSIVCIRLLLQDHVANQQALKELQKQS